MKPTLSRRSSGVLLHPTSLPGPRGGALGSAAMGFVDFLADCGQSWWQMLPVCPPDKAGSPYASPSSFAGSPALICVDLMAQSGLLKKAELGQSKEKALRAAFAQFRRRAAREDREDFEAFRVQESAWLADHALFYALKDANLGRPWTEWDERLRRREPARLAEARARVGEEMRFREFEQWLFARQWRELRLRARARGVGLMGDAPLYVRHDSVDVWAHQELFSLDETGNPAVVAGVPPDYFSKTGQLWGNPLYRWDRHRDTGFAWWVSRLRSCADRFDALRLDHFIGFRNYWEIVVGETTAVRGRWVQAPGDDLMEALRRDVPSIELIAEDLGVLTPEVKVLRDKFGLPGMRVAQFSFGSEEKDWPCHWPEHSVGYTGTHDNNTARGWYEDGEAKEMERQAFQNALGRQPELPSWDMTSLVWHSPARTAIAPLQDLLNVGGEGRMNRPGTVEGNWRWRMNADDLTVRLAGRLGALTGACQRGEQAP